ncbi:MAG: hypothetical protein LBU97_06115 [Alistipes sp.]|jgi:hypothetical protein|nr:hypothetical protein [Alistipes sp.]
MKHDLKFDTEQIRTLAGRWLAGETTLEEEATLREFFATASTGVSDDTKKDVRYDLPADLQPYRPLFGHSAEAAGQRTSRRIVLHTDHTDHTAQAATTHTAPTAGAPTVSTTAPASRPMRRWIAAASGIAAAVAIAVTLLVGPGRYGDDTGFGSEGSLSTSSTGDILCVVNGERITDPDRIALHTREAIELVNDNLSRPGRALSTKLDGDPAMARVGEMLNELTGGNGSGGF